MSVYENGEAQSVFNFPWERNAEWTFTLFAQQWDAEVVNIYNGVVDVLAYSSEGHTLQYEFSGRNQFIQSLTWRDAEGLEHLRMTLAQTKSGYEGDAFFYRAGDLLDNLYENSDSDIYDSFFDSGHPSGEGWDTLVWYLDVEMADQGGQGSLAMKDRAGLSPLTRAWGSGATEKGAIGTIPSNSGEYTLTVTCRGQGSFIHLRVAGALVNQWTL